MRRKGFAAILRALVAALVATNSAKGAEPQRKPADLEPVGFWRRAVASVIDNILLTVALLPLLWLVYGDELSTAEPAFLGLYIDGLHFFMSVGLPALIIIALWEQIQTTPGKMVFRAIIVDASTGNKPTLRQFMIRYVGYLVSALPLGLGFLWAAFHPRKQAWHDLIAGTLVVNKNTRRRNPAFDD